MILYYPLALRRPGPWAKQYSAANAVAGACLHSMVGGMVAAMAELDRPDRQASWTFSVGRAGAVLQHFPLNASTFHAGSPEWNKRLVGIEHEGGPLSNPSEPLTTAQREASVALVRWIAEQGGWEMSRRGIALPYRTLWEHREVSSTQCPSGRIPWPAYVAAPPPPQPVLSPSWDMKQVVRVYRATDSDRAEVEELPQRAGKDRWLVEIPHNTP